MANNDHSINNIHALNKYTRNDKSLFNGIINDVLNKNIQFESDCNHIDITIDVDENDNACIISENNIIVEDFLDNIDEYNNAKFKQINNHNLEQSNEHAINNNELENESNNFFECFNDDVCINNVIPCDEEKTKELTTSYVFDVEDLKKKDIDQFDNMDFDIEKPKSKKIKKNVINRLGVSIVSTIMLLGGSWTKKILH